MRPSMFIKFDRIDGESHDDQHRSWIDVLSWSWGASMEVNTASGSRGRTKNVGQVQSFRFEKYIDRSSPALAYSTIVGTHIEKAAFQMTKAGDAGQALVFVKYLFEDVIIQSFETGAAGNAGLPVETVTVDFIKMTYQYILQSERGGGSERPEMIWDVAAGKGSLA